MALPDAVTDLVQGALDFFQLCCTSEHRVDIVEHKGLPEIICRHGVFRGDSLLKQLEELLVERSLELFHLDFQLPQLCLMNLCLHCLLLQYFRKLPVVNLELLLLIRCQFVLREVHPWLPDQLVHRRLLLTPQAPKHHVFQCPLSAVVRPSFPHGLFPLLSFPLQFQLL